MRKASLWLGVLLVVAAAHSAILDLNNTTGTNGLVMIDKRGALVRFFDPKTLQEISTLDIGNAPHDFAISPDHKTIYIPVYGDGVYNRNPHPGSSVAVVDLATRKLTATIDVSPYLAPHAAQVDAEGMLYVVCDISHMLLVINPKTRSIEAAIDTEGRGHWLAVPPGGSKAYVTNKNDKPFVSVIDLKTRKLVKRIPVPVGTEGLAPSPDGKRIAVVDFVEPLLLIIDTATDEIVDRIPLQGNTQDSFKPKYSPDGKTLFVVNQKEGLLNILHTADLHGKQTVLTVGKDPMGFTFSSDGKTALVSNHGDGTVSVIDLQEEKVSSSFKAGIGIETLAYY